MIKPQRRWLLVALCASPALMPLYMILVDGVNLPIMDQWGPDGAGLFIKAHEGQLTLGDFLAQDNEHRIVIPKLIFFLLGSLTNWNVIYEMLATWVVLCATSAGVLRLSIRTFGKDLDGGVLFVWLVCNLILFTPAQWEVLLGGMGLINALPGAFIVLGFNLISTDLKIWPKMVWIIGCCMAATFSFGNGLLAWPLLGAALAWPVSWIELKRKIPPLATFGAACILSVLLYVGGYHEPQHGPNQGAYFAGIPAIARYTLVFLGNAFGFVSTLWPTTNATLIGAGMLAMLAAAAGCFCFAWRRDPRADLPLRMLPWLLLGFYALLSAILAGLFRAGIGMEQAGSSRYVTFSVFLPVALIHLMPLICSDLHQRSARTITSTGSGWILVPSILASWLILLELLTLWPGFNAALNCRVQRRSAKAALLLIDAVPDSPQLAQTILADVGTLSEYVHKMNAMGRIQPPLVTADNASRLFEGESPGAGGVGLLEQATQPNVHELIVSGWAMNASQSHPADGVFLTCENDLGQPVIIAVASMGIARDDLAAEHQNSRFLLSGWEAHIPLARLRPSPRPRRVEAWVLDIQTGRAAKLAGAIPISSRSGGGGS